MSEQTQRGFPARNGSGAPNGTGLPHLWLILHRDILYAAVGLGLSQIPFIVNFFWSINHGKKVTSDNPWQSTTLEWQAPTPPPHGNFAIVPEVHRSPYEYSVPGHATDFTPQNEQ